MALLERYDREPGYNPVQLLDTLLGQLHLKNDAALSRVMRVDQSIVSKVRNRKAPVTACLLLRMHETTRLPVASLRRWMGVPAL